MQVSGQANRIAGLATLSAWMLPAITVLEEFIWRLPPIILIAYLYSIALLCLAARWAGLWAAPLHLTAANNEAALAEQSSALHLAVLAVFAAGYFGLLTTLMGLNRGAWFELPTLFQVDYFEYALTPLLWLLAWRLAVKLSRGKAEFNLGWHWKPVDVLFLLGLSGATWAALMIYMNYKQAAHGAMHVFGVAPGSVPQWIYVGLGLLFSVTNAFGEEAWFRSLFLGALRGLLGMWPALLLQGLCFGLLHWFGTPRGIYGLLLAGAWGILLGWWTYTRRSLWQALLVHILADFAIWYTTNG